MLWAGTKYRFAPRQSLGKRRWRIVRCADAESPFIIELQYAELGLADASRIFEHDPEHRLQLPGRRANDAQHIRCCRLLMQRFPQLVEQARVLDGDDGVVSEVLHQLDLPIGERADDLPVNAESADQLTIFEHRYGDHRPIAGEFGGGNDRWITLDVGLHPPNVGDLDNLFGSGDPS